MKKYFILFCFIVLFLFVYQIYSLDGLQGILASEFFEEDTKYSEDYSDNAFRKIRKGMTDEEVLSVIGRPFCIYWFYDDHCSVHFSNHKVSYDFNLSNKDKIIFNKVKEGMSEKQVISLLGQPLSTLWWFSKSPSDKSYRARKIKFVDDRVSGLRVTEIISYFYVD